MADDIVIEVAEYGPPVTVTPRIAEALDISIAVAEQRLRSLGQRLARSHSLDKSPIRISGGTIQVVGIAGIVTLGSGLELHIRPKFAGTTDDWQEDLLFLALFTSYGHLDPLQRIASRAGARNTMAELVARILTGMIIRNHRLPLKVRRKSVIHSFEPLDEIDPDLLLNPTEEGWEQTVYEMVRDNEYWATIYGGAMAVLPHVRDVHVASTLSETVRRWGVPISNPSRIRAKLPPRLSPWQPAYDLAYELLRNSGFSPGAGRSATFEFTMNTWRMWEALIERVLIMAFGADRVTLQPSYPIGTSIRGRRSSDIDVVPDAVFVGEAGPLIIDAKYKGRSEKGFKGISPADRYEAMAFMQAVSCRKAVLVMPSLSGASVDDAAVRLQTDKLPTGLLTAVSMGVGGIAKSLGVRKVIKTVRDVIMAEYEGASVVDGHVDVIE